MWVQNLCCFLLCMTTCQSYNILVFVPILSKSNHLMMSNVVYELANKGHHVSYYHAFPPKNTAANVREISAKSLSALLEGMPQYLLSNENHTIVGTTHERFNLGYTVNGQVLQDAETEKLLSSSENFDLVVFYEFSFYSLLGTLRRFDVPVVLLSCVPLIQSSSFRLGNPSLPSFLPNTIGLPLDSSRFLERLTNTFHYVFVACHEQFISYPRHRALAREYLPGQPDIYQYIERQNLILINSHNVISERVPLLPNSVEIGGFHLKNPQTLPQDLEEILTSSPDGVVLFSLGTRINIADLPKETLQDIFIVFARFPQMFLIKWTGNAPVSAPQNIKFAPWFPQKDLLAHPNIRGFITHGGILSIMESVLNAVPIIGIPRFFDQMKNIAFVEKQEFGVSIPFNQLSGAGLQVALTQLLSNSTLRENVQKKSQLLRDSPRDYMESTIFWMEYVIRHKGAHHLRYNGGKLPWYQKYLFDVLVFMLIFLSFLFFVLKQLLKLLFNR